MTITWFFSISTSDIAYSAKKMMEIQGADRIMNHVIPLENYNICNYEKMKVFNQNRSYAEATIWKGWPVRTLHKKSHEKFGLIYRFGWWGRPWENVSYLVCKLVSQCIFVNEWFGGPGWMRYQNCSCLPFPMRCPSNQIKTSNYKWSPHNTVNKQKITPDKWPFSWRVKWPSMEHINIKLVAKCTKYY